MCGWLFGQMNFSLLPIARRKVSSAAFFCDDRGSHPRPCLNRRRRDAAGVIEHLPQLRIYVASLSRPGNLYQCAQTEGIGLFPALRMIEHCALMRKGFFVWQDPAPPIFSQRTSCNLRSLRYSPHALFS